MLLVLAATLLPVMLMLWLLLQERTLTIAAERHQLQLRAEVVANDLEDKIAGTGQLLFGLGRVLLAHAERDGCSEFLNGVLPEHPQYTGILTILPDGALHCDSLQLRRQLQLNDRQYFQQALESDGIVVEPAVGRLTGKAVLQIAYPVRDKDRALKFVLSASLDLNRYADQVLRKQPYASTSFHLWNHDGSFALTLPTGQGVSAPGKDAIRETILAKATAGEGQLVKDGSMAWALSKAALPRSRNADLHLALAVPLSELESSANAQFRQSMIGLLVSMVFVIGATGLLGEFALRRHSARIMRAISRMDSGIYDEPLGPPYAKGELGQVMLALDRMAESLQHTTVR